MKKSIPYVVPAVVLGPAALAADNTPAAIDLQGFAGAKLLIAVGVGGITFDGSNKIEFKVTHSDDDSTYTAVAAADVLLGTNADTAVGTGGIVKSLIAAHASADIAEVEYVGGKRYLKVLADFTGTHGTATPLAVSVLKGLAHRTF
jgi:hypothetical protein